MQRAPNLPYAARRARLAAQLGADALAIVPTAPQQQRNRDSDFPYRPDSYFYYLTGFTEPDAWLLLDGSGRSTLFCQPRDPDLETWTGYRLGPDAAPDALGVDAAHAVDELDGLLPQLLANRAAVWFPFATHDGLQLQVEDWLQAVRAQARSGVLAPDAQRDLCALLDEMRLVKDAHELAIMRRAGRISARAHVRAMQRSARMLRAGETAREYHLEAELLHEFRQSGAQFPAYTSIVAAGANACVLHYPAGDALLRDGELVLIDAACELDGYASDITRTFPAGGRFTDAQRTLYELVLEAQKQAVAATRAGARFDDPHDAAVRVLTQGMLDLGLLDSNRVGSVDEAVAQRAYARFYMHRTSHWMGMDVHDCGSYVEPSERDQITEQRDPLSGKQVQKRPSRILQPGMVLTIEPGIYVRPTEGVPEEFWNIGIRIEDDAVVTPDGCELLTRDVPVAPDEIEALMRA
ncbi:MAG: aminopeptidase P N-terminal domain-containing protein [Ottowia sp.]|nr:aminopeptidase P N-terminal domain-containing protein [Ottowia sp.]